MSSKELCDKLIDQKIYLKRGERKIEPIITAQFNQKLRAIKTIRTLIKDQTIYLLDIWVTHKIIILHYTSTNYIVCM